MRGRSGKRPIQVVTVQHESVVQGPYTTFEGAALQSEKLLKCSIQGVVADSICNGCILAFFDR